MRDAAKGRIGKFIDEEKDAIPLATRAVGATYHLIRNLTYEIHIILESIDEFQRKNIELGKKGLSPKVVNMLKTQVMRAKDEVDGELRKASDMLGALTNE